MSASKRHGIDFPEEPEFDIKRANGILSMEMNTSTSDGSAQRPASEEEVNNLVRF